MAKLKIKNTNGALNPVEISQTGGGEKMIDIVQGLGYDVQIEGSLDVQAITVNGSPISGNGGSGTLPYLVYTALLSQSGTDAPVATILQNTIGNIVWTRTGVGVYKATSASLFTVDKTIYPPFGNFDGSGTITLPISDTSAIVGYYTLYRFNSANPNILELDVFDVAMAAAEFSTLFDTSSILIKVEVYP